MRKTATTANRGSSSRGRTATASKSATKKNAPAKKAAAKKAAPKKAVAKKAAPKKAAPKKNMMSDGEMLQEFMFEELKDVYWAEKHLLKVLPKMQKAATNPELKNAIAEHIQVTEGQVERLEDVFAMMGKKVQAKKCDGMTGITEEGISAIGETDKGTATRDVCIILASQKVEHYEIATYGTMAQLARTLGQNEIAEIFQEILDEEKQADEILTAIAESSINVEAAEEDEEEGEEENNDEQEEDDEA